MKKRKSKPAKSAKKKRARKAGWAEKAFHQTRGLVTEKDLTGELDEDLREAWLKLRAYGESLGAP